jgi:hypothetical protein
LFVMALTGCANSTPLVDEVQSVEVDDQRVTVTVLHGVCEDGERRLELTETQDAVRLRVSGARELPGDCVDMGVITTLTARLDAPLGERALVDASTDRVVDPA